MEHFLIITEGGPFQGRQIVDSEQYPWPLPGIIRTNMDHPYAYVKTDEEEPSDEGPKWAVYEWREIGG